MGANDVVGYVPIRVCGVIIVREIAVLGHVIAIKIVRLELVTVITDGVLVAVKIARVVIEIKRPGHDVLWNRTEAWLLTMVEWLISRSL
ncbi:hypothetical protein AWB91_08900 [Mycobacterium paraense]|uniref:Uncharacterized protein n=1 Tax=Mycobacterium paraense TaxID=767916 RepID=A0ABX3VRZ7_9MYCO|nr:hypothetical protein AWB91_08900 [Mycobacterium paraense]ORW38432.1 hypothetical protein AWB88_17815 [Mycobacterium paraense]